MPKYIQIDRPQYGINGNVPLFIGDDWNLTAKIILQDAANQSDVDLTGVSGITGYFPGVNGNIAASATITDAKSGKVLFSVARTTTSGAQANPTGVALFATMQDSTGKYTITTEDQPVVINVPGFFTP